MIFCLLHIASNFFHTALEGLIYARDYKVFSWIPIPRSSVQRFGCYTIGYGLPLLVVLTTLTLSLLSGTNHYIRTSIGDEACWLDEEYTLYVFIVPIALAMTISCVVVIAIIYRYY